MRHCLFAGAALMSLLTAGAASANPSVYPTGVTRYDPARAYNSYVVFGGANMGR